MTAQEHAERIARALEAEPTPGIRYWAEDPHTASRMLEVCTVDRVVVYTDGPDSSLAIPATDAEFIASCSPAALTALLAERTELLARVGELESQESWTVQEIAGAAVYAEVPDSQFESMLIDLSNTLKARRAALKGQPRRTERPAMNLADLPAIGQPIKGGLFAGLTTKQDGTHCAVLLLPAAPEKRLPWQKAMEWAATVEGELPTRPVAALLFANLRDRFEEAWHWTSESHEADGSYAWFQNFFYGLQSYGDKSYEGRARAVRLIPIDLKGQP